jgi:predicted ester cyclase
LDSRATFDSVQVAGNTIVLELTWRGTHRGPLQTPTGQIPATNKPIEIRACQVVEVKDGKVQLVRHYFDMATMLAQLGVGPAAT